MNFDQHDAGISDMASTYSSSVVGIKKKNLFGKLKVDDNIILKLNGSEINMT